MERILVKRMRTRYVAAGEDVSFGRRGAGDAALLRRLGERYGYKVQTIEKLKLHGQEVSSTYVRSQVEAGHMEEAAQLMGDFYTISGRVCHGAGLGHVLGMPRRICSPLKTNCCRLLAYIFPESFLEIAGMPPSAISDASPP